MITVVPTRGGMPAAGAADAMAEAGGIVVFVGEGARSAAQQPALPAFDAICVEAEIDDAAALVSALAPFLAGLSGFAQSHLIFPGSADGRDIAPRLAHCLGRPFHAGASQITADHAVLVRAGGHEDWIVPLAEPSVLTLIPGVRGVLASPVGPHIIESRQLSVPAPTVIATGEISTGAGTLALGKAARVVAGGLGMGNREEFQLLATLADRLGAALGGTRVAVDRGWLDVDRQIGVTGASIRPQLYFAFGISGAVQHLAGIERPALTISVNSDVDCPMMRYADLAVVSDAPAVVEAMLVELSSSGGSRET